MNYYECHITMEANADKIKPLVEELGWAFSAIDGDIILGEGVKCYATKHLSAKMHADMVLSLLLVAANKLTLRGAKVTRRKIELVIYDDRSTKVRIDDQVTDQDGYIQDIQDQGAQQSALDETACSSD